jgi:hypothetical protein
VIQLVDGYSGLPAVDAAPQFALDGAPCWPLAKPQAFYAFSDLAPGSYKLVVSGETFFSQKVTLQVPMATPLADGIVPCTLQPSPLYSYPPGTTLIRGRLTGSPATAPGRVPLAGIPVSARYATRRGKAMTAETWTFDRGAYDGRYALALRGRLAAPIEVNLEFRAPSGVRQQRTVRIESGVTTIVDAELT